jgi:nitrite reductase/ring-hydroxylating ferredoxin subunit
VTDRDRTEVAVCRVEDVPVADGVLVTVGGRSIGVFAVAGGLVAYENRCAHQGGPVCSGIVVGRLVEDLDAERAVVRERLSTDELHLVCPWHGLEYRLTTGVCAADPAYRLRPVALRVEDGTVLVSL